MVVKIMNVFYGSDCLPYKDKARSVHYPMVGQVFEGASNTTEIHFFVREIGGVDTTKWMSQAKLPSGKKGYRLLDKAYDNEIGEWYVSLPLSQFYTQEKGDVYISLNGYDGGEILEQDEDDNYVLVGTPVIQATGSIKLTMQYAVQIMPSDIAEYVSLDDILSFVSGKADTDYVENNYLRRIKLSTGDSAYYSDPLKDLLEDNALMEDFYQGDSCVFELEVSTSNGINTYFVSVRMTDSSYTAKVSVFAYGEDSSLHYGATNVDISSISLQNILSGITYQNVATQAYVQGALTNYYTKSQIDTFLNGKVDKTSDANKLYGTDNSGNQTTLTVETNTGNVARRDTNGQLTVPLTPSSSADATSKEYVDKSQVDVAYLNITEDYKLSVDLYDGNGDLITSSNVIDLPLESVVVGGSYDDTTESIILTLENGNTITIPVSDLVSGLATSTELQNAIAGCLAKKTGNNVIYINNGSGEPSTIPFTTSATPNTIVERDSNGDVIVPQTPTSDTSASSKKYVDGLKDYVDDNFLQGEGTYPGLTSGFAENLTPYSENSGAKDYTAFIFQTTGGNSETTNSLQLKELRGNSVKWNQQVDSPNQSKWYGSNATSVVSDGVITFTATQKGGRVYQSTTRVQGHKYLIKCDIKLSNVSQVAGTGTDRVKVIFDIGGTSGGAYPEATTDWQTVSYIFESQASGSDTSPSIQDNTNSDWLPVQVKNVQQFDLTEIYGTGNEPTSVVDFNRDYPNTYYSYNEGTLLSCKFNKIVNVGYNALENQPTISGTTGYSTDFIKVIAGQRYTFEIGEYELDEQTGFGNMLFDEYDESKTLIKSYNLRLNEQGEDVLNTNGDKGEHTLTNGTHYVKVRGYISSGEILSISKCCFHLTWDGSKTGFEQYSKHEYALPNIELRRVGSVYDTITPDGTLTRRIGVKAYESGDENDSSVRTDLTNTYYVLATPTTEQVSSYTENQIIDNWGTQEFVADSLIGIPVPQGNYFFYPVDYKAFIDSLGGREDIEYDASKIVSHTELTTAIGNIPTPDLTSVDSNVSPSTTNTYDLGSSSKKWKDLYLSGKIKDGTNEFNADNVIKFVDAPSSGNPSELTIALDEGKMVYVNGNSSNSNELYKYGAMFFPQGGSTGERWGIGYYFLQANHERVKIFQFRGIGISSYNWISLSNIERINGKNIPVNPTTNTSRQILYIDKNGGSLYWANEFLTLGSANIGSITSATITTGWYKNAIAISSGLANAVDVRVKMSNGAIYPAINNGGTELVIFNGVDFTADSITVDTIYYKEA